MGSHLSLKDPLQMAVWRLKMELLSIKFQILALESQKKQEPWTR